MTREAVLSTASNANRRSRLLASGLIGLALAVVLWAPDISYLFIVRIHLPLYELA